jgi:alkyl sulfatase BDS1-like metallo-beta-lactamase superfamily hydrolase
MYVKRKRSHRVYLVANRTLLGTLPWDDTQDFAASRQGFIATLDDLVIRDENGRPVYDIGAFAFLEEETLPPASTPACGGSPASTPTITAYSKSPTAFTRFAASISPS